MYSGRGLATRKIAFLPYREGVVPDRGGGRGKGVRASWRGRRKRAPSRVSSGKVQERHGGLVSVTCHRQLADKASKRESAHRKALPALEACLPPQTDDRASGRMASRGGAADFSTVCQSREAPGRLGVLHRPSARCKGPGWPCAGPGRPPPRPGSPGSPPWPRYQGGHWRIEWQRCLHTSCHHLALGERRWSPARKPQLERAGYSLLTPMCPPDGITRPHGPPNFPQRQTACRFSSYVRCHP